jgi:hypothetical protein
MDMLSIAWKMIGCCSWLSLILMLAAVGISCQYIFQKYEHHPQTLADKRTSIGQGRIRVAFIVFCLGLSLQVLAIAQANVLPGRQ